jgi:hypothetical protein
LQHINKTNNKVMENKTINEQESMRIISQMISNTQDKMEEKSGDVFLIFGYTTIAVSIAIWYLTSITGEYNWQFLWFSLPVIGFTLKALNDRRKKNRSNGYIVTYIDTIISKIWTIFGITALLISIPPFFLRGEFPILFCVILIMGMGTALTGMVTKFTPGIVGGLVAMICSYLCFFYHGLDSILVFALIFIPMMIVPGHILNYRSRNKVTKNNRNV